MKQSKDISAVQNAKKTGVVDVSELKIQFEDLAESQRKIAELIGMENYIKLSKRFGGDGSLYIQKYSEITKTARNREIRRRYNGHNIPQLANMYDLSERHVRIICCGSGDYEQMTF